MIPGFNVLTMPPTLAQLESVRMRHRKIQLGYLVCLAASLVVLALPFGGEPINDKPYSWLSNGWVSLAAAVASIFFLYKLIVLGRQMFTLQEIGWETFDALKSTDIPSVIAYCKNVKEQGRPLTRQEAEGLRALCAMSPDAIKKMIASYEKYDEAHPRKEVWYG